MYKILKISIISVRSQSLMQLSYANFTIHLNRNHSEFRLKLTVDSVFPFIQKSYSWKSDWVYYTAIYTIPYLVLYLFFTWSEIKKIGYLKLNH